MKKQKSAVERLAEHKMRKIDRRRAIRSGAWKVFKALSEGLLVAAVMAAVAAIAFGLAIGIQGGIEYRDNKAADKKQFGELAEMVSNLVLDRQSIETENRRLQFQINEREAEGQRLARRVSELEVKQKQPAPIPPTPVPWMFTNIIGTNLFLNCTNQIWATNTYACFTNISIRAWSGPVQDHLVPFKSKNGEIILQ